MRSALIFFWLLLSLSSWAHAWAKGDTTKARLGYRSSAGMGVRIISGLENLNKNLNSIDYPEIALTPLLYHFSTALSRGKGNFGAAYNFLIYPESKKGNLSNTGLGVGAELRYTRNFMQGDKSLVYPILGLGVQFSRFRNKFAEETTFSNAVNNPPLDPLGRTEPVRISGEEYYGTLGLGYERIINKDKKRNIAYCVGFQAAYYFGLYNEWTLDYQGIDTNANTGGFEIRFVFSVMRFPEKR
jgi:hypothetical protein